MRLTTLSLQLPLHPGNLPGFRACIAGLLGYEHELFHNHDGQFSDSDFLHWSYPLVQYSVRRGFATVTGIGEGATAVEKVLLPALPDSLRIGGAEYPVGGYRLENRQVSPGFSNEPLDYGLAGWIALNAANYRLWKEEPDPEVRKEILSQALTGQLRAMAEGLGLGNPSRAVGRVVEVDNQKRILWHGVQLLRFDVRMEANLFIPPGIGIGRAVAFGFGELMSAPYYLRYRMGKTYADNKFV